MGATLLLSSCATGPARITQSESANAIEQVVALNERMVKSLSRGDLSVLERVMAPEARVNGPHNKVATGHQILERFRNGALAHSEYDRKIEEAYVSGDVVVRMGEEVVVMRGSNQANVGEKMRRRFTSAWRKNNWAMAANCSAGDECRQYPLTELAARRKFKILATGYSTPERTDRAYFTKIRN